MVENPWHALTDEDGLVRARFAAFGDLRGDGRRAPTPLAGVTMAVIAESDPLGEFVVDGERVWHHEACQFEQVASTPECIGAEASWWSAVGGEGIVYESILSNRLLYTTFFEALDVMDLLSTLVSLKVPDPLPGSALHQYPCRRIAGKPQL